MNPGLITPVAAKMIRGLIDGSPVIANWSGAGCGKTYAIIQAAHILAETRRVLVPVTDYEGNVIPGEFSEEPPVILITAETQSKLRQNLMVEADKYFANIRGASLSKDSEDVYWQLENGAKIRFRYYAYFPSTGKNSILGQKYVAIFSDETHEIHESFLTEAPQRARLVSRCLVTGKLYNGQVIFSGMPQSNDGWLRFCRDLSHGREGVPPVDVLFIHERSNSNPVVNPPGTDFDYERDKIRPTCSSEDEFIARAQTIPGATYTIAGGYYDNVSSAHYPQGNIVDKKTVGYSKKNPTFISYDPGNNSTSVLFWQFCYIEGKRKAVIVDQYVPDEFTSDQTLLAYLRNSGYNIVQAIVDPFRGNQRSGQADGKTTVMLLQRPTTEDPDGLGPGLGVKVSANWPQYKTFVKDGIWRTRARICTLDGDRSILILDNVWNDDTCKRGIKFSLQNYGPDMKTGEPSKKGASEKASHICDAMRYFVIEHLWDTPEEEQKVSTPSRAKPSVQRQHFTQKNPSAISFGRSGSYGR